MTAQQSDLKSQDGWHSEISNRDQKEIVAQKIADYAQNGDVVGVGSGSTSYLAVCALGKSDKDVTVIPTSHEMAMACAAHDLKLGSLIQDYPVWGFDGADEVDPAGNMIKGRGGALWKEKMVMTATQGKTFILIDDTKKVDRLGQNFPIPVEIHSDAIITIERDLLSLGANNISLRQAVHKDGPVITENGFLILDVTFDQIVPDLEQKIKAITGVIETGLFTGFDPVIVDPSTNISRD